MASDTVLILAVVHNASPGVDAYDVEVKFYGERSGEKPISIGSDTIAFLPAATCETTQVFWTTLPSDTGTWEITVVVDPQDAIAEAFEGINDGDSRQVLQVVLASVSVEDVWSQLLELL